MRGPYKTRICWGCRKECSRNSFRAAGDKYCVGCLERRFADAAKVPEIDTRIALAHAQQHRCAICNKHSKRLVLDHDHATGIVRAMLCYGCNAALGLLQDSPELLTRAASYVVQHKKQPTGIPFKSSPTGSGYYRRMVDTDDVA